MARKKPAGADDRGGAPPAGDAGTVAAGTLAKLLMISTERLRQLSGEGWFQRVAPGRYRTAEAVQGYIRFFKDEQRRASKSASASRVQDARAREIELRTAREENRLTVPLVAC